MSRCLFTSMVCALVIAGASAPARTQSLGDLAKKEAERRKNVKDTGKVLTNKDVPRVPPSDSPPPSSPASEPSPAVSVVNSDPAATPGPVAESDKHDDVPKGEPYWRERQKVVLAQLDRDQFYLEALQTRVNTLTTDFVNRDDPAQRAVIAGERQKSLAEIARLTLAIVADKKAVTDFEDEAHRAGVPPGWLR